MASAAAAMAATMDPLAGGLAGSFFAFGGGALRLLLGAPGGFLVFGPLVEGAGAVAAGRGGSRGGTGASVARVAGVARGRRARGAGERAGGGEPRGGARRDLGGRIGHPTGSDVGGGGGTRVERLIAQSRGGGEYATARGSRRGRAGGSHWRRAREEAWREAKRWEEAVSEGHGERSGVPTSASARDDAPLRPC